jgi:hypothetical protein
LGRDRAAFADFRGKTTILRRQDGISFALSPAGRAFMTDTIKLGTCRDFDRILVKTRHSVYEMLVLSAGSGDVMVRGGVFGTEFQRATLTGSTFGGSAVKRRAICVGRFLELHVGGKAFVTSSVQAASHHRPAADAA